jgi:hypothetical protein
VKASSLCRIYVFIKVEIVSVAPSVFGRVELRNKPFLRPLLQASHFDRGPPLHGCKASGDISAGQQGDFGLKLSLRAVSQLTEQNYEGKIEYLEVKQTENWA